MKNVGVWALGLTGFLACPCHLPVTLGLIVGVFGGSAFGAFLLANPVIIYAVFTAYFLTGMVVLYRYLSVDPKRKPIKLVVSKQTREVNTLMGRRNNG